MSPGWRGSAWRKLVLPHRVMRLRKAERGVGLLRASVVALDIKTQADDAGRCTRKTFRLRMQRAIDAEAAEGFSHVDTLYPPPVAVAPVAPFVRDHQTTGNGTITLCDQIEAARRLGQNGGNTRTQHGGIER